MNATLPRRAVSQGHPLVIRTATEPLEISHLHDEFPMMSFQEKYQKMLGQAFRVSVISPP